MKNQRSRTDYKKTLQSWLPFIDYCINKFHEHAKSIPSLPLAEDPSASWQIQEVYTCFLWVVYELKQAKKFIQGIVQNTRQTQEKIQEEVDNG